MTSKEQYLAAYRTIRKGFTPSMTSDSQICAYNSYVMRNNNDSRLRYPKKNTLPK